MTTQNQTLTPKARAKRDAYDVSAAAELTAIKKSLETVQGSKFLRPESVSYIDRIADKVKRGKHLTPGEEAGLKKIAAAVAAQELQATKEYLSSAKRIGD